MLAVAVVTRDRFADGHLEIGIALETQLLAELDHARLADAERVRELLRRIVTQQPRVLQDEVCDAAFDRRHLVAFRADFDERRQAASGRQGQAWNGLESAEDRKSTR